MPGGFVFMESYYLALKELPEADRLLMYDAMLKYAFEGAAPELPAPLVGYFTLIKPSVDASLERYRNGKLGGRPKKT